MKKTYILLAIFTGLVTVSCIDKFASAKDDWYYIYIDGDIGRTVEISYLERESGVELAKKNVIVNKTVTLPFFVEVHTVDYLNKINYDSFLEVKTNNDSTTKALIFDESLKLDDQICKVFMVWDAENAVNECSYCKDLAKDSVYNYLKSINYPCYMEFSQGETSKKVRLYDWWYK
ncbi:MAG: hypothetical protein BGO29_05990 [Bacteroidales bacterium 36-12]|nr:MAG: hypothetical protein BGO29_05990 [Bacteroidales bacterium 36-12]